MTSNLTAPPVRPPQRASDRVKQSLTAMTGAKTPAKASEILGALVHQANLAPPQAEPAKPAPAGEDRRLFATDVLLGREPRDYVPSVCAVVIERAHRGYFMSDIAAELNISVARLYHWAERHPDFAAAMRTAENACLSFWQDAKHKVDALDGSPDLTPAVLTIMHRVVAGQMKLAQAQIHCKYNTLPAEMSATDSDCTSPSSDDSD